MTIAQIFKGIAISVPQQPKRRRISRLSARRIARIRKENVANGCVVYDAPIDPQANADGAYCRCEVDVQKLHAFVGRLNQASRKDRLVAMVARKLVAIPYLGFDKTADEPVINQGHHRIEAMVRLRISRTFISCHQHNVPDIVRLLA
ncbi:hypothetical protein VHN57_01185 [Sphingobium sp. WW5]|uniref:hypothetical protein n=1 Tax=unclassified Sphingobium TaxID=2611147 RepID=UPI003C27955F